MHKTTKKRLKISIIISSIIMGMVVGLAVAGVLEVRSARANVLNYELTFITPQQAIVFWKTKEPTIGSVKYGTNPYNLDRVSEQTSSEASEVHAVMLDDIPPNGVYVAIHDLHESRLVLPEVRLVKYEAEMPEGTHE